ncbi:exported hypothetical protein [Candidatus Desulfosporosinus infrequens]|uniref:DUF4367 domain-containing protein n=1 Tax=Candidatus Desulfosporosinus infrequens TaxID=2043169 RepID=A0A2U3L1V4_9FIRM|nr:exported hypothetical protein [Candidatus Desulfosporosinus infrequens]
MKKFISMFVLSCCILLCSCSFNSSQSDASSGAILPTQSVVENAGAASNNKLTMDDLIALVKKDTLTLDDFSSFTNGTNHESEYSLTNNIEFSLSFDGEKYNLDVSYWKEKSALSSVLLTRVSDSSAILLYSDDSKYKTNKGIKAFLNTHTSMSDYLTYSLPEGLSKGAFSADIGSGGGNLFIYDKAKIVNAPNAPREWLAAGGVMFYDRSHITFENGNISSVAPMWNHSGFLGNPERVSNCEANAVIVEAVHDLYTMAEIETANEAGNPIPEGERTAKMWYVFFAEERGNTAYTLYLNENYFSKDNIIALARSVHFNEGAFELNRNNPMSEPNPSSLTGLAEARQKVSFSIFIPTVVPAGLVTEHLSIVEGPPTFLKVDYLTKDGSTGLCVLNGPAGSGLAADPRKEGEAIKLRSNIPGHFLNNQPQFGGPILWWEETGSYVALSGPELNKTDLVKIAESMSSTAGIGSQS